MSTAIVKRKETGVAYILWLASFMGLSGLHRMYMGRWVSGLLWLCTGGLFMIGTILDFFMMDRMLDDASRGRGW
ncbi:MAG: TM2 domain-containing protein [Myxococcota bacterium]